MEWRFSVDDFKGDFKIVMLKMSSPFNRGNSKLHVLTIPTTIQNMIPGIISNMIPSMSSSNVVFVFVWTLGDPWICSLIANSMLTSISKRFSNLFNKQNQKWKCVSRFVLNVFSKQNQKRIRKYVHNDFKHGCNTNFGQCCVTICSSMKHAFETRSQA